MIIHWCCGDAGIIKTVAKGARRPKSPFVGKLDLFFECEIEIHHAKRGDLHILKDLVVEKNRLGIRKTYGQTLGASYFVKLVELVSEPENELPVVADLLDRALDYLTENQPDRRAVLFFEKKLAEELGIGEEHKEGIGAIESTFGKIPVQRRELTGRW